MRAVVIGGSVGGLLMAVALREHFDEVIVFERDADPGPTPRRGVPQGPQAHVLLGAGRRVMESLLPGLIDKLEGHGARTIDLGTDVLWYQGGYYKPKTPTGRYSVMIHRPPFEHEVRERVRALDGITLRFESAVTGLRQDGDRVDAVLLGDEVVPTDAVILATGRSKQLFKWFDALGIPQPEEARVPLGLCYASCWYDGVQCNEIARLSFCTRSKTKRHGISIQSYPDRVHMCLIGYFGDHPPTDQADYEAWADSLEAPLFRDIMSAGKPEGVVRFTIPEQIRRSWHELDLPTNLTVIGDAACALDPVFGQGITVLGLQALALGDFVQDGVLDGRGYQQQIHASSEEAWTITGIEAAAYEEARDHAPVPMAGFARWVLHHVGRASSVDREVLLALLDVMYLEAGAGTLFRPNILARILWPRRGNRTDPRVAAAVSTRGIAEEAREPEPPSV